MARDPRRGRASLFRYAGLTVTDDTVTGCYELDDEVFTESVRFSGVGTLQRPDVRAVAELWYLLAGLSYYKAGAATTIDLGQTPVAPSGRALLRAAIDDGLAEFAWRNELDLTDVGLDGGVECAEPVAAPPASRVVLPFGGGIDSVVAHSMLRDTERAPLFIVSHATGPFAPLEATAAVTTRRVVRATREIDAAILKRNPGHLQGHVPVTAFITLLAAIAALADGRGGVVMSNEHSASDATRTWRGRAVNHQWSKSAAAEALLAGAVAARVPGFVTASVLRDRSELWVSQRFATLTAFHRVFRSCNKAFPADPGARAARWCGECDKCLFIDLVLAPFLERSYLREILGVEPLADPGRRDQLAALVGSPGSDRPFECVGSEDECAVALVTVAATEAWRDAPSVTELAAELEPATTLGELLEPLGETRAPAEWLR